MKKNPSPFFALLVALLALLVAGQGLAWGFVLCIGENGGHLVVKQAASGKCAAESTCCAEGELAAHDHCNPCQDLLISLDSASHRLEDNDFGCSLSLPEQAVPVTLALPFRIDEHSPNFFSLPPPRPYTALTALRTVVLLN
ncbi:MAG: hypothetical protein WDA20_02785 [Desulfuromonadales bacterium]